MSIKLMSHSFYQYFLGLRRKHNLPELDDHGYIYPHEYIARFPSLVGTSPKFYPEHHPSIPHIFLGGPRNAEDYGPLGDELSHWLSKDEKAVVYLSLGTHFTLSESQISEFVGNVRKQNNYRVIWSLGREMRVLANSLELSTDHKLFFSDYLQQFTLLGHEKVKVFVNHGGLGSTIDLIKRRKPSVCAPQIFDQFFNCRKLASLSVAENVSSFSFEIIDDAIHKILRNYETYVKNTDLLAKDFEFYERRDKIEAFLTKIASKGEVEVITKFQFQFCSERCSQAWFITKGVIFSFCLVSLLLLVFSVRCLCNLCQRKTSKAKQN